MAADASALLASPANSHCHRHVRTARKTLLSARQRSFVPTLTFGSQPIESFVGDWFALHCWTGREIDLSRELTDRAIPYFLPFETKVKQSGRTRYEVREALFPGYLFICANPQAKHIEMFDAADAARSLGHTPQIVPGRVRLDELSSLHIACASGLPIFTVARRKNVGAKVQVYRGPFEGAVGYIIHTKRGCRLHLHVTSMDSSFELEVDEDDVEVVED